MQTKVSGSGQVHYISASPVAFDELVCLQRVKCVSILSNMQLIPIQREAPITHILVLCHNNQRHSPEGNLIPQVFKTMDAPSA